ncbi:hypothetical protein ColTof4_01229 [Colletotrichum tofieldiae]|nr:hypothetical protein ColTof3_08464 [Colletotrichum tofieldiae]GKT68806.1 hypothetical protein ColTof4_01229 [Colletotrichum tofieldiae]
MSPRFEELTLTGEICLNAEQAGQMLSGKRPLPEGTDEMMAKGSQYDWSEAHEVVWTPIFEERGFNPD